MHWALIDGNDRIVSASPAGAAALVEWLSQRLDRSSAERIAAAAAELRREQDRVRSNGSNHAPVRLDAAAGALRATIEAVAGEERLLMVTLTPPGDPVGQIGDLQRRLRRYDDILQDAMEGFFVVDEDCRIVQVNPAFCRMLGYSAEELLARRITDLELAEPGTAAPAYTRTGLHHFPAAHRHKRGHTVHLELSVNVLRDEGRKVLVGFARDVTEKIRTEEALSRLTWQHKLILHSAAEGIAGLDAEGRFTFVNPAGARALGAQAGELIGESAHRVLLGQDVGPAGCLDSACPICAVLKRHGRSLQVEAEFVRSDGTRYPVEYSLTPIIENTALVGAVLVFRDITEQRRAEEERRSYEAHAQQAHRLESLGMLAGGIAHDLNNMLVGILGNACLAQSQLPDETQVGERLERIIKACERASKVIRQILAYSGRLTCDAAPLDLNVLIDELAEFIRAAVPRNIDLTTRRHPSPLMIEADDGQLQQVLTNLLVNSVEAIGERPGSITIALAPQTFDAADLRRLFAGQELTPGEYAVLSVTDDGCGMSAETIQRIFEPFFSRKGAGRGLGMPALRGIVRAHGGGVRVESEPGAGTCVSAAFPMCTAAPAAAPPPLPAPAAPGCTTVLVIDDEEDVRDVVEHMLGRRGMRVLCAADGARGVEVFARHSTEIDVVLLDMTMPGKGGPEVYRELRAIRATVPIIVSSGYIEQGTLSRLGLKEAIPFIQKPFTTETLLSHIHEAVNGGEPGARLRPARF